MGALTPSGLPIVLDDLPAHTSGSAAGQVPLVGKDLRESSLEAVEMARADAVGAGCSL